MDFSIFIKAFLFGVSGSFTHCIGMCGGIALGQNALRLINEKAFVNSSRRFFAALAWEYYLGKGMSYAFLSLILLYVTSAFYHNPSLLFVKKIAIVTVILYLLYNLWSILQARRKSCDGILIKPFLKKITKFNLLLCGFCLGFIPCGLVYSAIVSILATSQDSLTVFFAAFFLG